MQCTAPIVAIGVLLLSGSSALATTKGLSQIVTPDFQGEGDLSLSLQIQDWGSKEGNHAPLTKDVGHVAGAK